MIENKAPDKLVIEEWRRSHSATGAVAAAHLPGPSGAPPTTTVAKEELRRRLLRMIITNEQARRNEA